MFGTELLSPCELLCFYFMWHPNEKKIFYFIRKFFYLTFSMVRLYRSMSYISFILLGKFFIWIFMHFVWYYGIKDHLVVILNLYLENLMHYFFSVLSILGAHSLNFSANFKKCGDLIENLPLFVLVMRIEFAKQTQTDTILDF